MTSSVATRGPILVVDDDAVVRHLICRILEDDGLTVVSAATGPRAVEQAITYAPTLVIVDVSVPLEGWRSLMAGLRATLGQHIPILALSASADIAEQARTVRARGYLQKPFDVEELIGAVRRVMSNT